MSMLKSCSARIASYLSFFFLAILFVNANTASSTVIYQPKTPTDLTRFSKIK